VELVFRGAPAEYQILVDFVEGTGDQQQNIDLRQGLCFGLIERHAL
jgi:hypothetical protein